jgi:hypothetical protein
MAAADTVMFLNADVFFSSGVDMPQVIRLNPAAKRMAVSMQKLMQHIASRDQKAIAGTRAATIIFPPSDTALQAALTLVANRLTAVI